MRKRQRAKNRLGKCESEGARKNKSGRKAHKRETAKGMEEERVSREGEGGRERESEGWGGCFGRARARE